MDWITEYVAIGDAPDALNHAAEFDAILCLLADCCDNRTDINGYCIPLHDGPGNRKEHVLAATDYIAEQVDKGKKVLVHCRAGRSRSVCIVAAYLMRHQGLSKRLAISMIAKKRQICLSDGVDEIFRHLRADNPSPKNGALFARFKKLLQKSKSENR
jgi:predicted protein tyrosine phosphatase